MTRVIGKEEYRRIKQGKVFSIKEAVLAKCYDCMASYVDGVADCGILECPLYRWQPYGKKKV